MIKSTPLRAAVGTGYVPSPLVTRRARLPVGAGFPPRRESIGSMSAVIKLADTGRARAG